MYEVRCVQADSPDIKPKPGSNDSVNSKEEHCDFKSALSTFKGSDVKVAPTSIKNTTKARGTF